MLIPSFKRVRPGCIKAMCGDEVVIIARHQKIWRAKRHGQLISETEFDSLSAAKEYVFDWLVEYA